MLTLMKGDKVVEGADKCADCSLLGFVFRYCNVNIEEVLGRNIKQSVVPCSFSRSFRYTLMPSVSIEENGEEIRIDYLLFVDRKNNVKR